MFIPFFFNKTEEEYKANPNKTYHNQLLGVVVILIFIGIYMAISATLATAGLRYISKYFMYLVVGIIAFLATAMIDYRKYQKYTLHAYLFVLVLLILVLIFGKHINGAKRWLNLGIFALQPSELAKLAIVFVVADFLQRRQNIIQSWKVFIAPIIYLSVYVLMIIFQRDLGTVSLLLVTVLAMLFVAGVSLKKILIVFCALIPIIIVFIIQNLYRIIRIQSYFKSFFDIYSAHDNIAKALVAFGSGGIFGKGIGASDMKMLHLPEFHTDFIFPIIGEEFGFFGVLCVIGIYLFVLYTGYKISITCKNLFGKYLSFGITTIFSVQVLMNMGMTTGIFPPKGIPLPFISYGGSSMLVSMLMMGVLYNIAKTESK